jgi:hypothetical protein
VLCLLCNGTSDSHMAKQYVRNKSSTCTVKIQNKEICQALAQSAPVTGDVTSM